ncbi:MAG TPA: AmmeMemoRadiSam system protein B, partial [candidate division Zixibacteria bacterium]|nr:AmmeMemoRadiSam system protein B [candidate division Zixibacteria bacterium]
MTTENKNIRKAACAGDWYPKSPVELTKQIAAFFAESEKVPLENSISALIVPHAGYIYSGKTAAKAYKQLEGKQYDTVVVVAPSHKVFFQGCSVFDGDGYATPLGVVEIDTELSEKIGTILPNVYLSNMGHGAGED